MLKFLDVSEICYMIQKLNSYNLLIEKVAEKGTWAIKDKIKKAKKVSESWKWTFYKGPNLKPSHINLASVLKHVKKMVEFTDLTHRTY